MLNRLHERHLPPLGSRDEMLAILLGEVYGKIPPRPESLTFHVTENFLPRGFCAGHAVCHRIVAEGRLGGRAFSFPFYAALPTAEGKHPFFVHINFRDAVPDRYMPTEELIDAGFAVLSFGYNDVTTDDNDFTNGLAGTLYPDGTRGEHDAGKLALWAWAAHRVLDYAETIGDRLDLTMATVCGHSRLGKTALLAAATDERFRFAYSNDSGCAGAAITRGKEGERVAAISGRFPHWFCPHYATYAEHEEAMPFDQHYLIAAIAPRRVLVGSASEDAWADPVSEQLACLAAAPAFPHGFRAPDRPAVIGEAFLLGDVGYHLREGAHYFSRADWRRLIEFINIHRESL